MNRKGYRQMDRHWASNVMLVAFLTGIVLKSSAQAPNTWTQKANFGGSARGSVVSFSIGNKGYFGTGGGQTGAVYVTHSDFWEFDPAANTWSQKANFGGGTRAGAVGFSVGSKGYVGTGNGSAGPFLNDFWEFDPVANTWIQKANFPGVGRSDASGFAIGGKGYLGMGGKQSAIPFLYFSDLWEYDPPTNTWTQKANLGLPRFGAACFTIGGKGYIGLGHEALTQPTSTFIYNDLWEYDPLINAWIQKANFGGAPRTWPAGISIGNKGYVGTGTGNPGDFWEYDPTANTWTQKASFGGGARAFAAGFSIGSKGYLGTGTAGNILTNDFWEYTPSALIHTDSVAVIPRCAGDSVLVPFTITGGFNAGNIFTAQLSDALGSFAAPVNIGSITGTTSGIITGFIPANTPAGTGYRVRVVSSNPALTGTDNGHNLAISIHVFVSVSISTALDTVCAAIPVTFTATGVNGGSNPVFQWKRNGINAGANTTSFTYTPSNKDTITCTLTSSLPCAAPPTAVSNAVILTVNPPNLSVVPASATFCQGDSIILRAVDSLTPGLNYQWQINSNNIPGATTFHYTAKSTGAYSLVFNIGNCTAGSAFIPVNVYTAPVPVIHLLSGAAMQTDIYSAYQWNFNDTAIAGATAQGYTATKNGAYTVTVTDGNGCTGTSTAVHFPWLDVAALNVLNEGLNLYPNPARGEVSISLPGSFPDAALLRISLFDIAGKKLSELYNGTVQDLRKRKALTLPPIAAGLYLVRIEVAGEGIVAIRKLSIR